MAAMADLRTKLKGSVVGSATLRVHASEPWEGVARITWVVGDLRLGAGYCDERDPEEAHRHNWGQLSGKFEVCETRTPLHVHLST